MLTCSRVFDGYLDLFVLLHLAPRHASVSVAVRAHHSDTPYLGHRLAVIPCSHGPRQQRAAPLVQLQMQAVVTACMLEFSGMFSIIASVLYRFVRVVLWRVSLRGVFVVRRTCSVHHPNAWRTVVEVAS